MSIVSFFVRAALMVVVIGAFLCTTVSADTEPTTRGKTWKVSDSDGDCQCSGEITLYANGRWSFSGWAFSTDSGDEYSIVFKFSNSSDEHLFNVRGYKDISIEGEWVRWEESGTFPSGHYDSAYYLRTSSDC